MTGTSNFADGLKITESDLAARANLFNNNAHEMLLGDSVLRAVFKEVATKPEKDLIMEARETLQIALEDDDISLTLGEIEDEEVIAQRFQDCAGDPEKFISKISDIQLSAANAWASVAIRMGLEDQFRSCFPTIETDQESLVNALDFVQPKKPELRQLLVG